MRDRQTSCFEPTAHTLGEIEREHVLPQASARGADVGVTVPGVECNVDRLRAGEQEQEPEQEHRASVAAAFGCSKVRESATI